MFLPKPNTDLFRDLFLFTTDNGGGEAAAAGGGATGGGAEPASSEGQAAATGKPAEASKAEAPLADRLKEAFASDDTKPAAEKPAEPDAKLAEGEKPGEGESKPLTATQKAIQAGIAEKLDGERDALKETLRAEIAAEGKTARQAEDDEVVSKAFDATVSNVKNDLKGIVIAAHNADGEPVKLQLTDQAIDRVLTPHLEKMKAVVRQVEEGQFLDGMADATLANLPNDEVRERFAESAGGKDWQEYQALYAEAMAPHTKWAKQMQSAHEAALTAKAAEVEEFLKNAPQGQASQKGGGAANTTTTDGKTVTENAAAIKEGRVDVRAELARLTGRR